MNLVRSMRRFTVNFVLGHWNDQNQIINCYRRENRESFDFSPRLSCWHFFSTNIDRNAWLFLFSTIVTEKKSIWILAHLQLTWLSMKPCSFLICLVLLFVLANKIQTMFIGDRLDLPDRHIGSALENRHRALQRIFQHNNDHQNRLNLPVSSDFLRSQWQALYDAKILEWSLLSNFDLNWTKNKACAKKIMICFLLALDSCLSFVKFYAQMFSTEEVSCKMRRKLKFQVNRSIWENLTAVIVSVSLFTKLLMMKINASRFAYTSCVSFCTHFNAKMFLFSIALKSASY